MQREAALDKGTCSGLNVGTAVCCQSLTTSIGMFVRFQNNFNFAAADEKWLMCTLNPPKPTESTKAG